jgi:hypothetical protein
LSEQVAADCSDLPKELVNVDKLEIDKTGKDSTGFKAIVENWNQDDLVLEIIDGFFLPKSNTTEMVSHVHLFDPKGSLKNPTLTIRTEMTASNYGGVRNLHCAVALYALAMDRRGTKRGIQTK